jgi:hypothetical protein
MEDSGQGSVTAAPVGCRVPDLDRESLLRDRSLSTKLSVLKAQRGLDRPRDDLLGGWRWIGPSGG